ncbi:hypothetical protein RF11_14255 [Thelohanellus kitauei]|uniref:Retrotransposon gag domain-containing protein n=1 Tax=Thelohanellus kitauei TaxID=669202 RepID=A0A0C2MVI9_THEKT|nr:hypothetical protein RF11_14255 [Thelohanellus kitauei]
MEKDQERTKKWDIHRFVQSTERLNTYIERFEIALEYHGISDIKEEHKRRKLLHHVVSETFSLLQTYFHPEHLRSVAYTRSIEYLNGYYNPRKAYMLERKQLYNVNGQKEKTLNRI